MFFTANILVLLIFTAPITIIFDAPIIPGLLSFVAAISVAIVGLRIRPGEASFLLTVIRPVIPVAAVPAIWMLIQVMPLPGSMLAHPIWRSAAEALGLPLVGSISIDPGATLIAFIWYLSVTATAFVAAAVAIDRLRAELVFFSLTIATSLIALMVITANLGLEFPRYYDGNQAHIAATDCAGLGIIFAAAGALQTYDQRRGLRANQSKSGVWLMFVVSLVALSICSIAFIIGAAGSTYFAVICGIATLIVSFMIRRFRIGPWEIAPIASLALLAAIAVVSLQSGTRTLDIAIAFADQAPPSLIKVTQRILAETSWTGTGAGTFGAVLPIYLGVDERATWYTAPTAAATIAVEMGRPFFWAILVAAAVLVLLLLRGASRRQRDSFYSMNGASCIVAMTLLAFSNITLLSTPVTLIGTVAIGIAIAQCKSRHI